jgi:hypothetical protein
LNDSSVEFFYIPDSEQRPERLAALFGEPFDESYWRANNPASIVADNPARIRDSGLEIYLECGDQDAFAEISALKSTISSLIQY